MMRKRGLAFNFAWLFAIIVGAVIILIAIFATTQLIKTSRVESETKTAAQLGIILNPIETNLEDSKYAVITFPDETRVFNRCRETGNFGRQIISTSVKSGIGQEFQIPSVENFFFNKYIFSKPIEQGKELHVLAKAFEMPYKVADLLFASMENYCFVSPPDDIADEVSDLNIKNINLSSSERECPSNSNIVCFNNACSGDVNVNLENQRVIKNGKEFYYEDTLIYGAIFSSPEIYECQVKRLMKRTSELAHVYAEKSDFLTAKGCSSNLAGDLRNFASLVQEIEDSSGLTIISSQAENLRRKNENLNCKLF